MGNINTLRFKNSIYNHLLAHKYEPIRTAAINAHQLADFLATCDSMRDDDAIDLARIVLVAISDDLAALTKQLAENKLEESK